MSKEILLEEIKKAKNAHLLWVKRAKHLVQDLPVAENMIPLDPKECEFGHWFYAQAIKFDSLPSTAKIIKDIEACHDLVHDLYFDIYEIFFIETKQTGILKKFHFGNKRVGESRRSDAVGYFLELEEASGNLIKLIDAFENTIRNANENLIFKAIHST